MVLTSNIFARQLEQSSDFVLSHTAAQIEQIYREFETAERLFLRDEEFILEFARPDTPIEKQVKKAYQFMQYAAHVQYINAGFQVSIIVPKPHYLSQYGLSVRSDPALLAGLFPSAEGGSKRAFAVGEDSNGRTFNWLVPFGDIVNKELYGRLEIRIPYGMISTILAEPLEVGQIQYLTIDRDNRIIISADDIPDSTTLESVIMEANRKNADLPGQNPASGDHSTFVRMIGNDWMLTGEIPRKQILAPLDKVHRWTIGIMISQIVLTSILAIGLARNFSRPIQKLASLMKRKKNEGADIHIPQIERSDEIRALYDGIRELLAEIRMEQIEKKEYRLRLAAVPD
ncbi:hypothetical protein LJK88_13765 [Paenibacillus sp. P26]|nr:hypothetical protein LJK88_13765 [Paenibacillus sp. P26]